MIFERLLDNIYAIGDLSVAMNFNEISMYSVSEDVSTWHAKEMKNFLKNRDLN